MGTHERPIVHERGRQHRLAVVRADVAERHGGVALEPGSSARFIGEPSCAAENAGHIMPNSSRASVRASLPASASRARYGESSGSSRANRTFRGHTSWDVWRYTRFAIPLGTGAQTLALERGK
jgi:hypothetical protein